MFYWLHPVVLHSVVAVPFQQHPRVARREEASLKYFKSSLSYTLYDQLSTSENPVKIGPAIRHEI